MKDKTIKLLENKCKHYWTTIKMKLIKMVLVLSKMEKVHLGLSLSLNECTYKTWTECTEQLYADPKK